MNTLQHKCIFLLRARMKQCFGDILPYYKYMIVLTFAPESCASALREFSKCIKVYFFIVLHTCVTCSPGTYDDRLCCCRLNLSALGSRPPPLTGREWAERSGIREIENQLRIKTSFGQVLIRAFFVSL